MVVFPALAVMTAVLSFNLLVMRGAIGSIRGPLADIAQEFSRELFFKFAESSVRSRAGKSLLGQDHGVPRPRLKVRAALALSRQSRDIRSNPHSDGSPLLPRAKVSTSRVTGCVPIEV